MEPGQGWNYEQLKLLVRDQRLPLVLVDLDIFDANVRCLSEVAKAHGKYLRPASKSVRVPELLKRIFEVGGKHFRGLMCFSVAEARLLAAEGLDNLLVAYPTVQRPDLEALWEISAAGQVVTMVIDAPAQVRAVDSYWGKRTGNSDNCPPLRVCIEADMSWRPLGLHLGVHRSPVRSLSDFSRLLEVVLASPNTKLAGVMGYEAQIAGLGEENPFTPLLNPAKKLIKSLSRADVAAKRKAISDLLKDRRVELEFFNGGGTGSITSTSEEDCITEVAAGSGFLQSHLFDYYATNQNQPAFCFALQVTRVPQPDMVTCQSGGFIASGDIAADKAPVVFLPAGLKPLEREGFGEVQTPLLVPAELRGKIGPGDPVFFRPAKAGEIAERFNEYLLKRGDQIAGKAKTYRGMGYCFY